MKEHLNANEKHWERNNRNPWATEKESQIEKKRSEEQHNIENKKAQKTHKEEKQHCFANKLITIQMRRNEKRTEIIAIEIQLSSRVNNKNNDKYWYYANDKTTKFSCVS